MKFTYDKVKNDIWDVIKDRQDFVYESSSNCDLCTARNDWEYDPDEYDEEPPTCTQHYDGDSCRYFYADINGGSNYDTPACVVGNWFAYEKFSPEDFGVDTWENLEGSGVKSILSKSNIDIDEDAIEFLYQMQTYQDTTMSWGNSFERAVRDDEGYSDE